MTERSRPPDVSDAALALSQPPGADETPNTTLHPFGTKAAAGAFSGRGVMVGGNPDVWNQVRGLARDGYVDVVAQLPRDENWILYPEPTRVVTWAPPESEPVTADLHQAENPNEWQVVKAHPNLILNSWEYGDLTGKVILVESYFNEGQGLDFGMYHNYMAAGAKAVIPLCGGYSAPGRSDEESAAIYAHLGTWPAGECSFPGLWFYAGESPLTDECIEVLKGWKV